MASKLPYMMTGSAATSTVLSGGIVLPRETLPIITKPIAWTKKFIKYQETRAEKMEMKKQQDARFRARGVLISCKNKELNLYRGQQYGKFEPVPLASQSWKKKKHIGSSFVINSFGKNPAILDEEKTFGELNLSSEIVDAVSKMGYTHPTNIQTAAIPPILAGQNTLIAAETGNGKTLAFLAPLLHQLHQQRTRTGASSQDRSYNSPSVLVIAPGRELATQIKEMGSTLAAPLGLNVEVVLGAERTKDKIRFPKLSQPDVLVATLGVLCKLVSAGVLHTGRVQHVVLDEVDTLLDDSFSDQMTRFLKRIPIRSEGDLTSGAQMVLAGATLPRSLDKILEGIVDVPSLLRVSTDTLHRVAPHVTQRFMRLNPEGKTEKVLDMARQADKTGRPTIIFCNSSRAVDWLGLTFKEKNINCVHITGQQHSSLRKSCYQRFFTGDVNVMTCTDLVSRGLDTITAQHVINFDFPQYVSDYIHRCGRVGRVGSKHNSPLVTSFICYPSEVELLQEVEYSVRRAESLPNVNANIKRLYVVNKQKRDEMAARKEAQIAQKKAMFAAEKEDKKREAAFKL